jgi:hypothetical protein
MSFKYSLHINYKARLISEHSPVLQIWRYVQNTDFTFDIPYIYLQIRAVF